MIHRGVTGQCHGYRLFGVTSADAEPAKPSEYQRRGIHVKESLTVNRLPWDLYQFWRNFDNLPRFMRHVKSVRRLPTKRIPTGWSTAPRARASSGTPRSSTTSRTRWSRGVPLAGATVDNAGSVRFVPGPEGRGTEVRVVIDYIPPAGRVGNWVATLFGKNPTSEIREDLRRFKQLMEAGELATTQEAVERRFVTPKATSDSGAQRRGRSSHSTGPGSFRPLASTLPLSSPRPIVTITPPDAG